MQIPRLRLGMTFTAIVILSAAKDLLFGFCRIAGSILLAGTLCAAASAQTKPAWADPAKTLRVAFPVAETGFDPQATSDLYSNHVQRAIFDTLYVFDYLARPYKLAPSAAAAMPEIADGGRTWTIRVRPGVFFTD